MSPGADSILVISSFNMEPTPVKEAAEPERKTSEGLSVLQKLAAEGLFNFKNFPEKNKKGIKKSAS